MKPTRAGFRIPWVISCLPMLPALPLISPSLLDSLEKQENTEGGLGGWGGGGMAAELLKLDSVGEKKRPVSAPSRYPHHPPETPPARINKSALWTSVSVCIMDDVADGL